MEARDQRGVRGVLVALAVIGSLWGSLWAAPGFAAALSRPELTPCKGPRLPAEARCGTYEVFENRAARTGRKIPLRIMVLPATGPGRLPDPFVYFAGGPGDASIPEGLEVVHDLASLRRKRDVLLVDLRGTGESGGLFCTELKGKEAVQGFLDDFLPTDKIRACRDRLKKEVDLSWYTTGARQKAACEGWPIRRLGPDLLAPVLSNVPSLLISGERDPATPAAGAERVARTLKRARHLVVADAAHSTEGMKGDSCLSLLVAAFIEAGTTEGLDASCLAGIRRPEFVLRLNSTEVKIEPEVTVARADLERLPGSYAAEEMGLSLKVELVEGRLRLTIIEGPPFPPSLLIPTSPTRFRWEGEGMAPGLSVAFQLTGGKATALTVVQPGKPELVMKRSE